MKWLLQKPALWLWQAFGVVTGTNPSLIDSDVSPVIDVGQGGYGQMTYDFIGFQHLPAASNLTTVLARDPKLARVVWISGVNSLTGVAQSIQWRLDLPNGTVFGVRLTVADGNRFTHLQMANVPGPIFVPPGAAFSVTSDVVAAGSVDWQVIVGSCPAGFKPF